MRHAPIQVTSEAEDFDEREDGTLVLCTGEGVEHRVRPARDGVVVEVWRRTAVVELSADEVAMAYAIAERPKERATPHRHPRNGVIST